MTKKILLNKGYYVLVDDEDYEWLNKRKWNVFKPSHTVNHELYYARRTWYFGKVDGKRVEVGVLMHRLIMGAKDGEIVDHINNNSLDNRKENLRIVTHRENQLNRVQNTTSKCPGVYFDKSKQRYICMIVINGKHKNFGGFKDEKDACERCKESYHYLKLGKVDEIPNTTLYKINKNII
jgi:hypothetical protein